MKYVFISLFLIGLSMETKAQNTENRPDSLPFHQIPDYPASFSAGNVAARTVDGLGFRYYWATEGLRPEDLAYQPGDSARTSRETLEHIRYLTLILLNSVTGKVNGPADDDIPFDELRKITLENLEKATNILKNSTEEDLAGYKIIFKRGEKTIEYPFWNQLNGPIADALWHVGQVVSFRRSSGNPFTSKVSVLSGRVKD